MQFVDHESVACATARMPFEKMGMIAWQIVMRVRQHLNICRRPNPEGDHCADQRQRGGCPESCPHAFNCAGLSGEWIGDEPAHMTERELRGEQDGAIFLRR